MAKPIRIIGNPDSQRPNKLSSAVLHHSKPLHANGICIHYLFAWWFVRLHTVIRHIIRKNNKTKIWVENFFVFDGLLAQISVR